MAVQDQVLWANAGISVGGEDRVFHRGDLLPDPVTAQEKSVRYVLRLGGAIRAVEVVPTAAEVRAQVLAEVEAGKKAAGAAQVKAADASGPPGGAGQAPQVTVVGAPEGGQRSRARGGQAGQS